MRALILAAGRGARLGPLTNERPKCLVHLAGRSLLEWQLEALGACGIHDVAIVLGWRRRAVQRADLVRFVNRNWRRTNMVASLLVARTWLAAAPTIVAYGDVVYHPAVVRRLVTAPDDITIAYDRDWRELWQARFTRPEDDAESLRVVDGRVRAIGQRVRHLRAIDGQFMGLLRLTPAGLAQIEAWLASQDAEAVARLETTHLLQALVAEGVHVGALGARGRWCEIDTIGDVALYERRLAAASPWRHDWRPTGA